MKLRLIASFLLIAMLFAFTSSVAAQSYTFSLDQEIVNVFWNSDGTIAVDYVFTFTNDPGGHVIDFVDVGMPNGNFDLSTATADVGGNSVNVSSDFQGDGPYGFSVDMGAYAIQPGQTGSVHVSVGRITNMLYKDTTDPTTYASGEFSPAYFTGAYGSISTCRRVYHRRNRVTMPRKAVGRAATSPRLLMIIRIVSPTPGSVPRPMALPSIRSVSLSRTNTSRRAPS